MAFNPVKRVRERTYPTAAHADVADRLKTLADLSPSTTTPYLTVTLDWRPSGADPEYRGGLQRFEHEANRIRQQHWPRGTVYDSLSADIERIRTWLTEDVDSATQGVFVVANSELDVFEPVQLGLPLINHVEAGPIPALMRLARMDEDHPTYAVLLADQQRASVSLISQSRRIHEMTSKSSDYPRKQATGGWSQRRFQQRADERLAELGRQIAAETQRFLEEYGVGELIIAGDDLITGVLDRTVSGELRERVIATIRLDANANEREIIEATTPIAREAERKREEGAVDAVTDQLGANGQAVSGSANVLEALAAGRVHQLLINQDFHEDGWADFEHGRYGAGERRDVFGTGEWDFDAAPLNVEEELVRLAIKSGAEIDVIHVAVPVDDDAYDEIPESGDVPRTPAAMKLDALGGVAALLRY